MSTTTRHRKPEDARCLADLPAPAKTAEDFAICERPCAKCPWTLANTGDRDYLRDGRREDAWEQCALNDAPFLCHETVKHSDDDDGESAYVPSRSDKVCAGWLLAVVQHDGPIPQIVRIAERLGFDLDDWAERHSSVKTWEPPEVQTCNTVSEGCLAPAGYAGSGGVVRGTVAADEECFTCGDPCCSNCLDHDGNCGTCTEFEDDDDE